MIANAGIGSLNPLATGECSRTNFVLPSDSAESFIV